MAAQKPSAAAYARIIGANLFAILLAHSVLDGFWAFIWMIFQSILNIILGSATYDPATHRTYGQAWYVSAALVFLIGFGTCLHTFNQP